MTTTTPRLRPAAVASVAVLALVGLSACGSSDQIYKATDQTTSSSSATQSAGASSDSPAAYSAGSDVSPAQMADLVKNALSKATTAHITLASSGSSGLSGAGDMDFGPPVAMHFSMTIGPVGQAEALLVDKTMYIKVAQLGDKYVKFDLDDPNSPLGSLGASLDPTTLLSQLADSITKATYVGREAVDGDQADHYTVTLDSSKTLGELPSLVPSAAASSIPKTVTVDIWFDPSGLFRQVQVGPGGTGSLTMDFTQWGQPVNVTAPPADQVTEMPGLPGTAASS